MYKRATDDAADKKIYKFKTAENLLRSITSPIFKYYIYFKKKVNNKNNKVIDFTIRDMIVTRRKNFYYSVIL